MQEYSRPANVTIDPEENLADMVWANADRFGDDVSLRRRSGGVWEPVTSAQFAAEVTATAKGLIAAGIRPGDRVGLLAETSYEWTLCDFAIWSAGAVTVPIYQTSSAEQIQWILEDSGAVAVLVDTAARAGVVRGLAGDLAALHHVWTLVDGDLRELQRSGADIVDADLLAARRSRGAADVASIVYTSGTTGRPKGCRITHANLLYMTRTIVELDFVRPGGSTLLFLPLAHVFARIIEVCTIDHRAVLANSADTASILADAHEVRPTYILAVPRMFEKIYNTARAKAAGRVKSAIFARAEHTAIEWSKALDTGGPGWVLAARHALYGRLVYGSLLGALGGRCHAAISGGAPLGERLAHFFRGVGLTVFEGYGLTETTAGTCVNTSVAMRIGTVGRPMPGMSVRIAEDGEIEFKGPLVFDGYWNNPEATAEAVRDGWFRTGDLGTLDDGYLRITGRKKEILVTAAGKNVAPAVLEDRLRAHPLISQCMVVGDGQPFIAALITIDAEFLGPWKAANGKPAEAGPADLADDPDLRAEVQKAVDDANQAVSRAESIRAFVILGEDFTVANGILTPSEKLRRKVAMQRYEVQIDALYGGRPAGPVR